MWCWLDYVRHVEISKNHYQKQSLLAMPLKHYDNDPTDRAIKHFEI